MAPPIELTDKSEAPAPADSLFYDYTAALLRREPRRHQASLVKSSTATATIKMAETHLPANASDERPWYQRLADRAAGTFHARVNELAATRSGQAIETAIVAGEFGAMSSPPFALKSVFDVTAELRKGNTDSVAWAVATPLLGMATILPGSKLLGKEGQQILNQEARVLEEPREVGPGEVRTEGETGSVREGTDRSPGDAEIPRATPHCNLGSAERALKEMAESRTITSDELLASATQAANHSPSSTRLDDLLRTASARDRLTGGAANIHDGNLAEPKHNPEVSGHDSAQINFEKATTVDVNEFTATSGMIVRARRGQTIRATKGAVVFAEDGSNVIAIEGSRVYARAGSNVTSKFSGQLDEDLFAEVHAEEGSVVHARQYSRVFAGNGSSVVADYGSEVFAEPGSTVRALASSEVTARGATVTAEEGSFVNALEDSLVFGKRGSRTSAGNGSTVFAEEASSVIARDGSTVNARAGSKVLAKKGSTVAADKGSMVYSYNGSTTFAREGSTVYAKDGAIVLARSGSTTYADTGSAVYAEPDAVVFAYKGSNVYADGATIHAEDPKSIKTTTPSMITGLSGEFVKTPLPSDMDVKEQIAALRQLSRENKSDIKKFLWDLEDKYGVHSNYNYKTPEAIQGKAFRPAILEQKPWFTVAHETDVLRFETVLDDIKTLPQIVDEMQARGWHIVKYDDRLLQPTSLGWRITSFDLRMPNGQLVEYQLPIHELHDTKKGGNHKIYAKWRGRKPAELSATEQAEMDSDIATSKQKFDQAWRDYLTRTGEDEQTISDVMQQVRAKVQNKAGSTQH